jgi:hypothetical protein
VLKSSSKLNLSPHYVNLVFEKNWGLPLPSTFRKNPMVSEKKFLRGPPNGRGPNQNPLPPIKNHLARPWFCECCDQVVQNKNTNCTCMSKLIHLKDCKHISGIAWGWGGVHAPPPPPSYIMLGQILLKNRTIH